MKVKIFESYKPEQLESLINHFLDTEVTQTTGWHVIDIKYSTSMKQNWYEGMGEIHGFQQEGAELVYSAMIIYTP